VLGQEGDGNLLSSLRLSKRSKLKRDGNYQVLLTKIKIV
jgi:hypothetical protein